MNKKTISLLLAVLVLVLALSACGKTKTPASGSDVTEPVATAPASASDVQQPTSTLTPDGHLNFLSICGIAIVRDGGVTGLGFKGADYKDGVLTLTDVDIVCDMGENIAINFSGDLEIVLVGENSVTATNGMSAIVGGAEEPNYAASLKFSGDGSLSVNAEGENAAALACTGTVGFEGTGTLEFTGGRCAISGEGGALTYAEGIGVVEQSDTHVVIGKQA